MKMPLHPKTTVQQTRHLSRETGLMVCVVATASGSTGFSLVSRDAATAEKLKVLHDPAIPVNAQPDLGTALLRHAVDSAREIISCQL